MKRKTTFLAKAFLMLFAVLLSAAGAKAQQAIPYSYGFEDNDLTTDGWVLQGATSSSTGIFTAAYQNGSYGFRFHYSEQNAYLLSPVLTGTDKGVEVTFYYKEYSTTYGAEQFQVGYTTDETATDASTFTYGDIINAATTTWEKYTQTFPAGTKRIAVKYIFNDIFYLFLDDFTFDVPATVAKPTGLKVSYTGGTQATLSWSSDDELFDIDVNGTVIEDVENPYTLTGLSYETEYTVMVRAKKDGEVSKWSDPVSFTTGVQFPAPTDVAASDVTAFTANISWNSTADSYNLRYRSVAEGAVIFSDSFEEGLSQWTIVRNGEGNDNTDWRQFDGSFNTKIPGHSGEYMAMSRSWSSSAYNVDNWMISPLVELGGILKFWVMDDGQYHEHYDIYVSTSTNDISAFTKVYEPGEATSDWTEVTVNLSKFAGQQGYFAFRHTDADQDYLLIDDVTLTAAVVTEWTLVNGATSPYSIEGLDPDTNYDVQVQAVYADGESAWASTNFTTAEDVATPSDLAASDVTKTSAVLTWTENGEATAWEIMLNDDETNLISADSNPFTLTGLTPETTYTAKVRAVNGEKTSKWSNAVSFTTLIAFPAPTDLAAGDITVSSATISWTNDDADATGAELQYAVGILPTEYKYDNGTATGTVAAGGDAFDYAVMFPAGSFTGNKLYTVSVFDAAAASGGTLTVYSDGTASPGTALASKNLTLTGSGTFINFDFEGLEIDPTKNLWIVATNPSGASVATAADVLDDANGRWLNYGGWMDMANAGVPGRCWLIHANIGYATESELTWTTVADATSPAELTGLTPGTAYAVRVKSIFGTEGESQWAYTAFTTVDENPVPSNIAAELAADGAVLTWEGKGDSYNVQYRTAASEGAAIFEEDFENGLGQWTIITEGEGPGWVIGDETGTNAATAYSWNSSGSYDADNWLISPAIELNGVLKFTAANATQYPDSYEVLLSTTGTETTDFTETLQAMSTTTGNITIDLSAYAGQTGYIAFHHVSYDCYLLAIDDFGVYEVIPAGAWENMAVTDKTATISGLATNNAYEYQIQSVKDNSASEWTEAAQFALLTLDNNSDNTGNINKFNGMTAHVTLADRTIYKDGTWNTVYLPFDLTPDEFDASPLAGADVRTLRNALTVENESVTMNFTDAGVITQAWGVYYGGVPYIMKWDSGSDVVSPEFANVTITKNESPMTGSDTNSGISIVFKGTYAPINFTAEDTSILFIGANNEINHPLAGAKIGAMRAYFQLEGASAGEESGVKIFTNLDDLDDATGIANIEKAENTGDWYDISGRKLAGKPSVKGIYVNGGRKVTIK